MDRPRFRFLSIALALLISGAVLAHGQDQKPPEVPSDPKAAQTQSTQEQDPLTWPLAKGKGGLKKENNAFKKWPESVRWIITDEELGAFKRLGTNAERLRFIEIFWDNRDPTPDAEENEYKEEYEQRVVYANEHFSAGMPGEKTDRGHIYIVHGKPDSIDAHPMGGPYQRSAMEGGGTTETHSKQNIASAARFVVE